MRRATATDLPLLAEWNHQLIRDEGLTNPMTVAQLAERMRGWLDGGHRAFLFGAEGDPVAYALCLEDAERVYLRHLFVRRDRRRTGVGRACVRALRAEAWTPGKQVVVEVLCGNPGAVAFYRSVGFADYSLALQLPAE